MVVTAVALLDSTASFASCSAKDDDVVSQYEKVTFIPPAPDYNDATMWVTADGDTDGTGADIFYVVSTWEEDWTQRSMVNGQWSMAICHYADVWNPEHRGRMGDLEINKVAANMSPGNRFFAPFYRHTTMEAWLTQNEDTIRNRTRLSMGDVCAAFDHFQAHRDTSRPLIIAGFSQGGHIRPAEGETDTGVTICYNTVKDVKYVIPVISASDICINPVNWRTDATPATLHDTITVTVSPERHVLVVSGYSGSEYAAYKGFINVGDIHSCEPWLYSECLAENIKVRAKEWRKLHQPTVTRIQERGEILIGTTGDYRPLSFREEDGSYWGFGIEVAGEIARRLGVDRRPTRRPAVEHAVQPWRDRRADA